MNVKRLLPLLVVILTPLDTWALDPPAAATLDLLLQTSREEAVAARWDDADALVTTGLRLAESSGDQARSVRFQVQRAHVLLDRASYQGASFEDAFALLERTVRSARELGDAQVLSDALHALGRAHYMRQFTVPARDYATASAAFREARSLRDAAPDLSRRAETLFYQGLVHEQSGRDDEARATYEQALALVISARDPLLQSYLYRHLAGYQETTRGLPGVLDYFQRSLRLREQAGFGVGVVFGNIAVGETLLKMERASDAVAHFERALTAAQEAGIHRGAASAHLGLAAAAAARGERDVRRRHARAALVAAAHTTDPELLAEVSKALAAASAAP